MEGKGLINLKIDQHSYHEHSTLAEASAEARRLASTLSSPVVIYLAIKRVDPPQSLTEKRVEVPHDAAAYVDNLPF